MINCSKITQVLLTTWRYSADHISLCGIPCKSYLALGDTAQTIPRAVGYRANHISRWGIPRKPYLALGVTVQTISRVGSYHANHTSR